MKKKGLLFRLFTGPDYEEKIANAKTEDEKHLWQYREHQAYSYSTGPWHDRIECFLAFLRAIGQWLSL